MSADAFDRLGTWWPTADDGFLSHIQEDVLSNEGIQVKFVRQTDVLPGVALKCNSSSLLVSYLPYFSFLLLLLMVLLPVTSSTQRSKTETSWNVDGLVWSFVCLSVSARWMFGRHRHRLPHVQIAAEDRRWSLRKYQTRPNFLFYSLPNCSPPVCVHLFCQPSSNSNWPLRSFDLSIEISWPTRSVRSLARGSRIFPLNLTYVVSCGQILAFSLLVKFLKLAFVLNLDAEYARVALSANFCTFVRVTWEKWSWRIHPTGRNLRSYLRRFAPLLGRRVREPDCLHCFKIIGDWLIWCDLVWSAPLLPYYLNLFVRILSSSVPQLWCKFPPGRRLIVLTDFHNWNFLNL